MLRGCVLHIHIVIVKYYWSSDHSYRDGQFVCRIFRGPIMPSWSFAHSNIQDATLATRSTATRGPMPMRFDQNHVSFDNLRTYQRDRKRSRVITWHIRIMDDICIPLGKCVFIAIRIRHVAGSLIDPVIFIRAVSADRNVSPTNWRLLPLFFMMNIVFERDTLYQIRRQIG